MLAFFASNYSTICNIFSLKPSVILIVVNMGFAKVVAVIVTTAGRAPDVTNKLVILDV